MGGKYNAEDFIPGVLAQISQSEYCSIFIIFTYSVENEFGIMHWALEELKLEKNTSYLKHRINLNS